MGPYPRNNIIPVLLKNVQPQIQTNFQATPIIIILALHSSYVRILESYITGLSPWPFTESDIVDEIAGNSYAPDIVARYTSHSGILY